MTVPSQLSAFNNQIPPRYVIRNITATYTVTGADYGVFLNCTGTSGYTVNLSSAASLGAGFNFWILNNSATITMQVTITPASGTIDGTTSLILQRGEGMQIFCDGLTWQTSSKKTMRGYAENMASNAGRPSVTGSNSVALGTSQASGSASFAAAIGSNSSYGATSANSVALGSFAAASASSALALGASASASGTGATMITGNGVGAGGGASGSYSMALGSAQFGNSYGPVASGNSSNAFGPGASSVIDGKYAFASGDDLNGSTSPYYPGLQAGLTILRNGTTGNTPTVLVCGPVFAAASTNNQIVLPNNSAFAFSILVVGRQQAAGGTASAAWKIEGLIRQEGTASTTTLVNSTTTVLSNSPGWAVAVAADTTNGALKITVTGAAATNIRWVATANTAEVNYA